MKTLNPSVILHNLKAELQRIAYQPDDFICAALAQAYQTEKSELAQDVLGSLLENIDIASEGNFPLCQDTGLCVFWVRIGKDLSLAGIYLDSLINQAVAEVFAGTNLRCSVVADPIHRINTRDNTPAIIHYEWVEGKALDISILLKGGGSENMSALKMLTPAAGIQGIRDFVLETVKKAGGNACPPLVVGVGVGGNFETCAWLAKKALFRHCEIGCMNYKDDLSVFWRQEEEYLLKEINALGIGAMGFGGSTTALKVNIEVAPCHIASLPVAVNLECHAHRMGFLNYEV